MNSFSNCHVMDGCSKYTSQRQDMNVQHDKSLDLSAWNSGYSAVDNERKSSADQGNQRTSPDAIGPNQGKCWIQKIIPPHCDVSVFISHFFPAIYFDASRWIFKCVCSPSSWSFWNRPTFLQIGNEYWFQSDREVSLTDLWGEQYTLTSQYTRFNSWDY